jgi:hypothetical protein
VTRRQGRRRTKLLDNLKERREYSPLKEEALDRTMWRARVERDFGPVARQTTKRMNYMHVARAKKMQLIPYITASTEDVLIYSGRQQKRGQINWPVTKVNVQKQRENRSTFIFR